jgi:phosphoglycolate phosphatase
VNLVFDLDGTLIDSRPRLYRLFQQLAPDSTLTHETYWAFKQDKISNETILAQQFGYTTAAIGSFVDAWMDLIEAPEFLALDSNFPGMAETLERLRGQAVLHVCTARQHRQPALDQLERLGLLGYFSSVLVTQQRHDKQELIAAIPGLGTDDWILGDTGKDVQIGRALNMKTCAVLSGFLSEKSLLAYQPDLILPSAAQFRLPEPML